MFFISYLDKTIDELLNKIILMDCAEYYNAKTSPWWCSGNRIKASMKIDFDNNTVDVKILMKAQSALYSNIIKMKC